MNSLTYPDIEQLLAAHDADVGAAEAHGMAVGMLCLAQAIDSDIWLNELFQFPPQLSEPELQLLNALFQGTQAALSAEDFEFDLFLPSDDSMLSQQLEAFSNWCRGFLFGIGYGRTDSNWPGDSGDILKDLIEFTKLDTQAYSEGDEQALTELHEYCRAAILLLRDDLRANNQQHH